MTGVQTLSILLCAVFCGAFGEDAVPVLIWNTNQAQAGVAGVSALQVISADTFEAKYLQDFAPSNILLFEQDVLSVEDLSSHTTELQHMSHWMSTSHSLYLPNVENPTRIVHDLPARGYNVFTLEPGTSIAGLQLKDQEKNLVIVKLPSTRTNPSRKRALQKADEVMASVLSKIGAQREFTVIFTGRAPSVQSGRERLRIARSLQASEEKKRGFHKGDCVLMYLRQDMRLLTYKNETKLTDQVLSEDDIKPADISDCHDDISGIKIYYSITMDGVSSSDGVMFHFKMAKGDWELTEVKITYNGNKVLILEPEINLEGIPLGLSYSCTQGQKLRSKVEADGTWAQLVISSFQVQPFTGTTDVRFSGAWDCVGFFTVPIWCALLVVLLLLTILFTGLFAVSEIKTMDRFDDPKGKPITVTAAE